MKTWLYKSSPISFSTKKLLYFCKALATILFITPNIFSGIVLSNIPNKSLGLGVSLEDKHVLYLVFALKAHPI